ncbi:hypothetical protein B9Z19DRAFT_1084230 [Tuber borchii]|uniref:Uncharacterized protein n=1 Tax=Tuber borchii TaxID=42251 RepID=A0A2T6ZSG6_TUBBO|nr:hypothetical protein B9Z19DRAFT_1084230 [Tuber borchii]
MASLPVPDPDATRAPSRLLSTISSLFKSKSSRRNPSFRTSVEGTDSVEVKDRVVSSQLPADFELKTAGPEKKLWSKIPDLQSTDEYAASISNFRIEKGKHSSTAHSCPHPGHGQNREEAVLLPPHRVLHHIQLRQEWGMDPHLYCILYYCVISLFGVLGLQ